MSGRDETHSLAVGYVLWIFGFLGAHRFYFGKPISGTLYLLTLGLLGIGWILDLFLMPRLERQAELRFNEGPLDYTVGWVLLTFLGAFGIHRLPRISTFRMIIFILPRIGVVAKFILLPCTYR